MQKITIDMLQKSLNENLNIEEGVKIDTDLRAIIRDSIDLGEVLASLDIEVDLQKFHDVVTVADFLELVNR